MWGVLIALIVLYVFLVWWLNDKRRYTMVADLPVRAPQQQQTPERFDWREHGMHPDVPDAGNCGACYIYAALIPFQLRNNLPPLSANYLLRCQAYCSPGVCDDGCDGGLVDHTWQFLKDHGVPAASADALSCDAQPPYRARDVYKLPPDVDAIKSEIMRSGPVSAGMTAHEDFVAFTGDGIYRHDPASALVGGHAVVLLGWGPGYWIGLNTWGRGWGDNGFFKIPFTIQDDVVAGR